MEVGGTACAKHARGSAFHPQRQKTNKNKHPKPDGFQTQGLCPISLRRWVPGWLRAGPAPVTEWLKGQLGQERHLVARPPAWLLRSSPPLPSGTWTRAGARCPPPLRHSEDRPAGSALLVPADSQRQRPRDPPGPLPEGLRPSCPLFGAQTGPPGMTPPHPHRAGRLRGPRKPDSIY